MRGLAELYATKWVGKAETWSDPLGDVVAVSKCNVQINDKDTINYTWEKEGVEHHGSLTITNKGAGGYFTDSFHTSGAEMMLAFVPNTRTLLCLEGVYQEVWGWRISLSYRNPTGELVIQMTNIAPWGEEARAVRIVVSRDQN